MKSASRVWGVKQNGTLNQCAKFQFFLPRRSMGNGCMSNFHLLHGQKIISAKLREDWTKSVVEVAFLRFLT